MREVLAVISLIVIGVTLLLSFVFLAIRDARGNNIVGYTIKTPEYTYTCPNYDVISPSGDTTLFRIIFKDSFGRKLGEILTDTYSVDLEYNEL